MSKKNRYSKPDTLYASTVFDEDGTPHSTYACDITQLQYYSAGEGDFRLYFEDMNSKQNIYYSSKFKEWQLWIDEDNPWPDNTITPFDRI